MVVLVALLLAASASAQAATCAPDPTRLPDTWYVTDKTTHQELKPTQLAALPELHSYEVSFTPGSPSTREVEVEGLSLAPPAGVTSAREGHALIVTPQGPGPLTILATWTEHDGVNPDCTQSASLTLTIASLSERPGVRIAKHTYADRPLVAFTFTVARGPLAVADPIAVLAKVGAAPRAPSGRPATLFTLPLAPLAFGVTPPSSGLLGQRSAKLSGVRLEADSAFETGNSAEVPVPSGGTGARVTISFNGSGHGNGEFFHAGVLARRGLAVELVQDGRTLAQLSTGILCASHSHGGVGCQLRGYHAAV